MPRRPTQLPSVRAATRAAALKARGVVPGLDDASYLLGGKTIVGALLGGAVVVETVFGWPGLGLLLVLALLWWKIL